MEIVRKNEKSEEVLMKFNYEIDGEKTTIDISGNEQSFKLSIGDISRDFTVKKIKNRNYIVIGENGKVYDVFVDNNGEGNIVFFKGMGFKVKDSNLIRKRGGFEIEGEVTVKSPLPGQIKKIFKSEGDEVEDGEGILVLEAMKMENEIKAPKKGKIKKIFLKENSSVESDGKLFTVE